MLTAGIASVTQFLCLHTLYDTVHATHAHTADGTAPVERTEPVDTPSKQLQEEQWYASVNSECECKHPVKCGDKYKEIVRARRAFGACSEQNVRDIRHLRRSLLFKLHRDKPRCHFYAASPTCDMLHMPRELLPSVAVASHSSIDKWPYLTQATIDTLKAMAVVRYYNRDECTQHLASAWRTMQVRMQQYAVSGAGTVAEAIVHNDCWWSGDQTGYAAATMQSVVNSST
jgi:hypothetical protein